MHDQANRPARLRPLDPAEVPELGDVFDIFIKERGKVPNMFRTLARRSKHLRTLLQHFQTVMREGTVPPLLKELISVRVSAINSCRYWLDSHTALAARFGATRTQVEAAVSGELEGAGFSAAELAALRFSEALTLGSTAMPEELFRELGRHFDEGALVEICMVAGLFNYFNRVNNALDVEPTR